MISLTLQSLKKWPIYILIISASLSSLSCTEEPPLKIGFVGGMTGRVADLGVAGRDGVILAVEEKNQSGGIAGRKVKLVVKNDRQEEESARQAIRELTDEQVLAIIGPMTSSIAMVIQPLINAGRMVTLSPTVKADQFSGQDDFFLRVTAPLSRNAELMAAHAVDGLNLKRFAVVYDLTNQAFTESWFNYFKQAVQRKGGQIVIEEAFSSQPEMRFLPIAESLLKTEPDGVLLLSNAIDTALLAQQIRKLGSNVALFSSEWAFTTDLLSFGGRAVNGMTSFHSFDVDSQEALFLSFKERFTRRFGSAPSFATVLAYDAASYLFAGLEKNPHRDGLKETLLSLGAFPGLQSTITLDAYGDVERKLFMTVVEDGQFKVVQ